MKPSPRGRPFKSGTPRLPRAERRESLLKAATESFVERGYDGTSMDSIAERGGVSKPVLYQHFDSKHDLYMEILLAAVRQLRDRVTAVLDNSQAPYDRVRAVVTAYFTFVDEECDASKLIYTAAVASDQQIYSVVQNLRHSLAREFADNIASSAEIDKPTAELLGHGLAGMLTTASEHWFSESNGITREDAIRSLTKVSFFGINSLDEDAAS
ncbi:TetR/AcrR family transcriptional regulator [Micrococcoides hystricis]|uniref:TetR/AcrR family transcriptional regulator n=1 Tax=Micrococcoides hystricis TaxID=1572761 RepID=A0ABV6P9R1_9MICC